MKDSHIFSVFSRDPPSSAPAMGILNKVYPALMGKKQSCGLRTRTPRQKKKPGGVEVEESCPLLGSIFKGRKKTWFQISHARLAADTSCMSREVGRQTVSSFWFFKRKKPLSCMLCFIFRPDVPHLCCLSLKDRFFSTNVRNSQAAKNPTVGCNYVSFSWNNEVQLPAWWDSFNLAHFQLERNIFIRARGTVAFKGDWGPGPTGTFPFFCLNDNLFKKLNLTCWYNRVLFFFFFPWTYGSCVETLPRHTSETHLAACQDQESSPSSPLCSRFSLDSLRLHLSPCYLRCRQSNPLSLVLFSFPVLPSKPPPPSPKSSEFPTAICWDLFFSPPPSSSLSRHTEASGPTDFTFMFLCCFAFSPNGQTAVLPFLYITHNPAWWCLSHPLSGFMSLTAELMPQGDYMYSFWFVVTGAKCPHFNPLSFLNSMSGGLFAEQPAPFAAFCLIVFS